MTGTSWGAAVAEVRRVTSRMTKVDGERILLDREGSQRSLETRVFEWKGEECAGFSAPGLEGWQRVEGSQAESQRQLQRPFGLEVLKKRTRPSRWRRVNRTEASLLSTIAEWGPLSRALALGPAPLPPNGSASQLSQFHKAESSFVQHLG